MTRIDTTIRRWCEACQRFTRSALGDRGYEICAEHCVRGWLKV